MLLLASILTYYFILPSILPSRPSFSISSSRLSGPSRSRLRSSRWAGPDPSLAKLGRDFSLTPYLDARWPAGPAGIELLAHATPSELAISGLNADELPPHVWLTVFTPRTTFLASAVARLNDLRRRGSPPGETLTGRAKGRQPLGPAKGGEGEKVLDLAGLGMGVTGKPKGDEPVVRETALVVLCAEDECEKACEKEGWWCFSGYKGRGTTVSCSRCRDSIGRECHADELGALPLPFATRSQPG